VLDEAMGTAVWLAGHRAVAVHLELNFLKMLPLGTDALLEAHIDSAAERKIRARGRLLDENGIPFAEATGLFLELAPDHLEHLLSEAAAAGIDSEELMARFEGRLRPGRGS
jgi:hypothetical protein